MKLLGKQELMDKLAGMPGTFRDDMAAGKWCAAALDYGDQADPHGSERQGNADCTV